MLLHEHEEDQKEKRENLNTLGETDQMPSNLTSSMVLNTVEWVEKQ